MEARRAARREIREDSGAGSLHTHTVSWRIASDRCESTTKRCSKLGEGWVVDTRRPPAVISIAYLCEEHAQLSIERHEQLGVQARFVRGHFDGKIRRLNVEWRILEDE